MQNKSTTGKSSANFNIQVSDKTQSMLNPNGILKSGKDKERESKMTDMKKLEELIKIKID